MNIWHLRTTAYIFLLVSTSCLADAPQAGGAEPAIQLDVAYGPDPQEVLDLCSPTDGRKAHPAVLLIHGGGWRNNDKKLMAPLCNEFAKRGYVSAAIDYRLLDTHTLRNQWPSQLVDEQLAVRWLKANGARLGVDSGRICAYGTSAGGHLALFLGLLPKSWHGDRDTLYADQSPSVACVVDICGPTDLGSSSEKVLRLAKLLVPATADNNSEAALRRASPIAYVTPTAAPTLVVQGSDDELVPKSQALLLVQAFQQSKASVKYLEYQGGHVYAKTKPGERAALIDSEVEFMASIIGR